MTDPTTEAKLRAMVADVPITIPLPDDDRAAFEAGLEELLIVAQDMLAEGDCGIPVSDLLAVPFCKQSPIKSGHLLALALVQLARTKSGAKDVLKHYGRALDSLRQTTAALNVALHYATTEQQAFSEGAWGDAVAELDGCREALRQATEFLERAEETVIVFSVDEPATKGST